MGFWEIVLVVMIALIVVGPERLPELARGVGRAWGQLQHSLGAIQRDLQGGSKLANWEKVIEKHQKRVMRKDDDDE